MRVPLLSFILATLVTVAVGSTVNPDIDALRNVERQAPVQVCLPCLALGTTCLTSVPSLCCSGACTQTSSDVPEVGTCTQQCIPTDSPCDISDPGQCCNEICGVNSSLGSGYYCY
ncbi:hypothetical protein BKA82DRAFT_4149831 [Pisolithus tinctorius]|nr:hypothetical protein BKA82DRAFT_4149831 [Pisolithus tinctorius]